MDAEFEGAKVAESFLSEASMLCPGDGKGDESPLLSEFPCACVTEARGRV